MAEIELGQWEAVVTSEERRLRFRSCRDHSRSIALTDLAEAYANTNHVARALRVMRRAKRYAAIHTPQLLNYITRRISELSALQEGSR